MIDAATRARWRKLFSLATAGPWVLAPMRSPARGLEIIAPTYGRPVRLWGEDGHTEDMELTSYARDGWPRTLDDLEATERRLDRAKDELETTGAELRAARLLLAQVIDERDAARSERDSAVMARRASDAEMSAVTKHQTAYAARAEALFSAMRRWKRDRFAPALLQAWEEFNKPCA